MSAEYWAANPPAAPTPDRAARQVRLRNMVVAASFSWVALLAIGMLTFHGGQSQSVSSSSGTGVTTTSNASLTLYQVNPTPVLVILIVLLGACIVGLLSLRFRIRGASADLGVSCIIAIVCGLMSVLALLSVGLFIAPLAVMLVVISLPLDQLQGQVR
jgi:hypothetical protein